MREYIETNEIYLSADKVYTPNGIVIKKTKTYKNDTLKVPDMYLKIIEREACTIAGYKFTINNGETERIIYVTDKKLFQEAVDTMASIFIGENEYKKYKDKTQSPIDTTGSIIEKVYLQEDITYKAVNIDTKEITTEEYFANFIVLFLYLLIFS